MSDASSVVSTCLALVSRVTKARDNFTNFAIQFPSALYARRGLSELVERLAGLGDRIEAGAPTLPNQILLRLLDLLQSVDGVCDELEKADENTDFVNFSIVRVNFHKKALEIALDLVNLSIRVQAVQAGFNEDTQSIAADTSHILSNINKLQASIGATQNDSTAHPGAAEKTANIKRFIQSSVTYLHIQRDDIGVSDDASIGSGSSATQVAFRGTPMEVAYLYDTPRLPDDNPHSISFDMQSEDKDNSLTVIGQQKRIVRYDQARKEGQDVIVPASCFGIWTRTSPDGTLVFRGDEETFSLYSITRKMRIGSGDCGCIVHFKQSHRHKLWKGDSVFSPDSKKMALAFSTITDDDKPHEAFWKARIWKISADKGRLEDISKIKGHLVGPGQQMARLAFSPDGTRIVAVSCKLHMEGQQEQAPGPAMAFCVWDVATGATLHICMAPLEIGETLRLKGKVIHPFEWNSKWVLAVWFKETSRFIIWDILRSKIVFDRNLRFLIGPGKEDVQVGFALKGSDVLVVRATMGCLQVWNAMHCQMLGVVQDTDWMYDQPFLSPDGRFLVARSERKDKSGDTVGRVWRLVL